jgi:general secretion pathway protein K
MRLQQRGSVIIVALWTITVMTILVAVIASQNRLSAQVAWFQQQDVAIWADLLAAINQAEMDVVLELQPPPPTSESELSDSSASIAEELNALFDPRSRFNGEELQLNYPQPADIAVRIYDHAGKINLRELNRGKLREMIEKKLGGPQQADQQQIDEMMEAWNDWQDLNDGASVIGAETDYYMGLDPPYMPRNGTLETVEEILLIRGFAEVFGDVDLDAAFTLYGEDDLVNLNVATIEAMRLMPGLDDELIEQIVAYRRENKFQGNGDVAQVVPAEQMATLRRWLNSTKSGTHFSILVYQKDPENAASPEESDENAEEATEEREEREEQESQDGASTKSWRTAYSEIVFVSSSSNRPQILKVNPYQRIPEELPVVDSETEDEEPE